MRKIFIRTQLPNLTFSRWFGGTIYFLPTVYFYKSNGIYTNNRANRKFRSHSITFCWLCFEWTIFIDKLIKQW